MLDMGFLPALRRIMPALPRTRQTLLFSATLPDDVIKLSTDFTRDAVRVDVSDGQAVVATVQHHVHPVAVDRKRDLLTHVLTPGSAESGARLLQDQARLESRRRAPRARGRQGGGHSRQQEPGRAHSRARRLQGRSRHGAGRHRHRRARPRHRAASAGRQLRSAARGRGLHSPCGSDRTGGTDGTRRVAGVGSRIGTAARRAAAAVGAARAGGRPGIRRPELGTVHLRAAAARSDVPSARPIERRACQERSGAAAPGSSTLLVTRAISVTLAQSVRKMTFPVGAWRQRGYINTRPEGHRVPRLKVRTWGPPPVVHSTGTHPFRISDVGGEPIKDDDARMRMAMARE